ncbi:MAG: hypothetical protein HY650_09730 [Acidobacteria bacterium]|nr:hypothetical protein [Acidobacteriota bacterium]
MFRYNSRASGEKPMQKPDRKGGLRNFKYNSRASGEKPMQKPDRKGGLRNSPPDPSGFDRVPKLSRVRRRGLRLLPVLLILLSLFPIAPLSRFVCPDGSPAILIAADKGKKHYDEGKKLEAAGKSDQAAESYLMAVSFDDRAVYRIAYRRAALKASFEMTQRGRELMEKGEYAEAYNAFRRSYSIRPDQ